MAIYVKYKNLIPKNSKATDNTASIVDIKTQLVNDVCWGSGVSDFLAVKKLLQEDSWEEYRPKIKPITEDDPGSFELKFCDDFFNFETEGINHFIGTIAGDILLNSKIERIDVDDFHIDHEKLKYFPGPNYGIDGVYKLFNINNQELNRPLLAYSIKPRMGYTIDQFKAIFSEAAKGGVDIIEDDERLIDPIYCPFCERVIEAEKLKKKYPKTYYSVNITGPLDKMRERVKFAYDHNIKFVKIDVLVTGFDALLEITKLIRNEKYDIRITVYPDAIGKYRNLSRHFVCKMARLCGADIIYAGSPSWSRDIIYSNSLIYECEKVHLRHEKLKCSIDDMVGIKPTLATMTNDISAQSAELITLIFNRCFSDTQFAFFIGHGISASRESIKDTVQDIIKRISAAAKAPNDDYNIEAVKQDFRDSEDLSQYDIPKYIGKFRKGY
ncbi:MAG: hypothetical protein GX999_06150 [Bacteroidales bacterium]|nr:hypothetical protein [Bacteroidales bacterium]